ncbi:hypothetical protein CDAR_550891 [Caerostris darwini]|uniref:Uncharacterized protein n=1 Tax=Caerostris darwini TaxID=1538125 RepID=A0AAV4QKZ3_9ARAC|nr:hypothetical protein CDAR_550891 [Caerostris darwini]
MLTNRQAHKLIGFLKRYVLSYRLWPIFRTLKLKEKTEEAAHVGFSLQPPKPSESGGVQLQETVAQLVVVPAVDGGVMVKLSQAIKEVIDFSLSNRSGLRDGQKVTCQLLEGSENYCWKHVSHRRL